MIKIYLSPSTQPHNMYWDKKHNEEQVMNNVTDALVDFLSRYDVEVIRGSIDLDTYKRIQQANQLKVDYYLALHSNAGGGLGCETFYQVGVNHSAVIKANSKNYAEKLNRDFATITPTNNRESDRGAQWKKQSDGRDWNHELRGVIVPANLIEIEFHDSEVGSTWILANINKIGQRIGRSIVDIFDLKSKNDVPNVPTIPADDYYFVQTGAYKTLQEAEVEASKIAKITGNGVGVKYGNKNSLKWIKSVK